MPVFEYKCSECETKFEILHKSTTVKEMIVCPVCNSSKNKKLFSSFSSTTKGEISHSDNNCRTGSCGLPASGCSTGLCGLN